MLHILKLRLIWHVITDYRKSFKIQILQASQCLLISHFSDLKEKQVLSMLNCNNIVGTYCDCDVRNQEWCAGKIKKPI